MRREFITRGLLVVVSATSSYSGALVSLHVHLKGRRNVAAVAIEYSFADMATAIVFIEGLTDERIEKALEKNKPVFDVVRAVESGLKRAASITKTSGQLTRETLNRRAMNKRYR